ALVPGQAEGGGGQLNHEEIELRVRRQPRDVDVHPLHRAERHDSHVGLRVWHTTACSGGDDHVEIIVGLLLLWFGQRSARAGQSRYSDRPNDDRQLLHPICPLHEASPFRSVPGVGLVRRWITDPRGGGFALRPRAGSPRWWEKLSRRDFVFTWGALVRLPTRPAHMAGGPRRAPAARL